jgi:phosphoribosylformylglycinamidine synthase
LTTESESISSSAVQIGNPIEEKKIVDCLLKAQDRNLYKSITDCGAGGLSSAVGETAEKTGAIVNLEKVPLKYEGLSYAEIWISESQERMVLGVDKKKIDELIKLFKSQDTEATVIGQYTDTGKLELFYHNNKVCQLDMQFLHHGIPQKKKKAVWQEPNLKEPNIKEKEDYTQDLCDLLSSYDIASKEWIIRQYDHEVQGQSVLKPLGGKYNDGANDAACINPVYGSNKGLLISCGINPYYGLIDPYWMAINVIDEALRQIIASGGSLDRVAVLDNFCWGSPEDPKQLGGLVRASIGCHDASIAYQVPFISGKDSLNNEYKADGKSVAVPGTLLISALSVIEDVSKILSSDLKQEGNYIYVVGLTKNELGASAFYRLEKKIGKNVPKGDCKKSYALMQTLSKVNEKGLIESCHDCSEGGLAVALAEMAISGDLGAKVDLGNVPLEMDKVKDYKILFSESMTRFIVEVKKNKKDKFEKMLKGLPFGLIGKVTSDKKLQVKGKDGKIKISEKISKLKKSWQEPLRW